MTTLSNSTTELIGSLRSQFSDRLIVPGDDRYDAARTVFGGFDRRPAMIVRVASESEVAQVVSFARETGTELAVRGGGHSPVGHGATDGGVMVDMTGLRALDIDADGRTAWAQTGLTAADYTRAVGRYGLATGFGDTGSVGIGGLTLSGGIGYLARKHGLTIDDLLAADIVTADGQVVRTDADNHQDLFWAIRGGGGNFGIATRFKFRLHDVSTTVGGRLILPATPEVITGFLAAANAAPDELTAIANLMPAPPLPFVPEEHHGRLVLSATLLHAGTIRAGLDAMTSFRALASPILDQLGPMDYRDIYPPVQAVLHPYIAARTLLTDDLDRGVASAIVDRLKASTAPMAIVQLRVLGGAVARVPVEATAFGHRHHRLMVWIGALYDRTGETAEHEAWAVGLAAAIPASSAALAGFLGDEGDARVRAAYPGRTWDRLRAIKNRYDPTNLFHLNQNISPAAADHQPRL